MARAGQMGQGQGKWSKGRANGQELGVWNKIRSRAPGFGLMEQDFVKFNENNQGTSLKINNLYLLTTDATRQWQPVYATRGIGTHGWHMRQ